MITKDLGAVSAYAYAVEKGYTGTETEFAELMASYASVAEQASQSAQTATEKAQQASASATSASQSADTASASAQTAQTAQQTATAKASEAQQSATTATTKAQEASQSATTATTKAQASAQSASQSAQYAERADQSADQSRRYASESAQYAESIDPQKLIGAYPTDTATGAIASFTDGADNIPMKKVTVRIEPKQAGTGDPSPDNARPISGWDSVQVSHSGVNVWDEEWEEGTINNVTGLPSSDPQNIRAVNYCSCVPGTEYYFYSGNSKPVRVYWYDAAYTLIESVVAQNNIRTPPSNAAWFKIRSTLEYGNVYHNDISVNYPATDTAYHPYAGNTYSITFPSEAGTVYGGELDVTNGVLTVDMAMVDLGTLTWGYAAASGYFYTAITNKAIDYNNIICSIYKTSAQPEIANLVDKSIVGENSGRSVLVKDSAYTDAATFKTAMSGAQLVYELATPITLTLTPTEIKSLLGDNNLWADTGGSTVTYRADTTLYINRKIAEAVSALS